MIKSVVKNITRPIVKSAIKSEGISWSSYWKTRYISALTVVTTSSTEQTVTTTIEGTGYDGVSFEYSTDNITFTVKGTSANGTYNATGLTANTLYYWRARLYKGSNYGNYSDVAQEYTATYKSLIENDANLLSFWRLDEASGTTLTDSKSDNDAEITGGVTLGTEIDFLADDDSRGVTIDGASGVGVIGNIAEFDFTRTSKFTLTAILKPNANRASGTSIDYWIYTKTNTSAPYNGLAIGIRWDVAAINGTRMVVLFGANWTSQYIYYIENDIDLLNTTTYLLTITYDGSATGYGFKSYANALLSGNRDLGAGGVSDEIDEGQDTTANVDAELFRRGSLGKWFNGDIKDIAIFNTEQSYSWVLKLYDFAKKLDAHNPVYTVNQSPRPQILYDCDIDSDIDDVVDLLMLLNLEHLQELDIKGIVVSSANNEAAACLYAILNYYGRTEIPIGVNTSALGTSTSLYNTGVVTKFGVVGKTTAADFDNYLITQRTLLAAAEDNSIEYLTTAALSSVKGLLESPADEISPLTGLELITAKVRTLFCVAGRWPTGAGVSDFSADIARATESAYVLANWPTTVPIIFVNINDGDTLKSGENVMVALNNLNPAKEAWNLYFGRLDPSDTREAWAQIGILPLARGFLWNQVKGPAYAMILGYKGTAQVNTTTLVSSWKNNPDSNHNIMGKVMSDAEYITEINGLIKDVTEW